MNKFLARSIAILGMIAIVVIFTSAILDSYILRRQVVHHAEYDFSQGKGPADIGDLTKLIARPSEKLQISFSFRLNGDLLQHRIGDGYQNIFQTSQANNGIRLEISTNEGPNSRMGLVVRSASGGMLGLDLGRMPVLERWHDLALEVVDGRLEVWLDGLAIGALSGVAPDLSVDDVAIGTGFSKQRPFNGQVRDFRISRRIVVFKEGRVFKLYAAFGSLAMGAWLLFAFFRFRSQGGESTLAKTVKAGSVLLSVLALFGAVVLLTPVRGSVALYFAYLSWCILALAIVASLRDFFGARSTRWVAGALLAVACYLGFLLYAVAASYLAHLDQGSGGISAADISSIFQSSWRESAEFLVSHFNRRELLLIFLIPIVPTLGVLMSFSTGMYGVRKPILVLPAVLVAIYVSIASPIRNSLAAELAAGYFEYQRNTAELNALIEERRSTHAITASKKETGELYVVVIGESENRDHMSAYGYFRTTTPWMDKKLADPNWLFFDNAYASFAHTVPSLSMALSQANQYNGNNSRHAATLIEVMNAAGFDTYWIDEQGGALGDTPLNAIAQVSKRTQYVSAQGEIKSALRGLLASMDRSKNNLIVLHLMGSHADYSLRVPDDYQVTFNDGVEELGNIARDREFVSKILDPYDRSVHYTDRLISELWDMTNAQVGDPSVFMYFSDHGEDVFGRKFHDASRFTFPMVRVPLIMQISPQWAERNRHRLEVLSRNRSRVFTLDMVFETVLGLSGIEGFDYDRRYDLGDDQYAIDESNALTMRTDGQLDLALYADTGTRYIRDDPQLIARRNLEYLNATFGDKVLSNYNDMKAKLYESASHGFKGVEFNIGVPSMSIGHYPESVYPVRLDEFLAYDAAKKLERYWLDLKVESGHSVSDALDKLEDLDPRFNLKKRSLVESWDDDLARFSEKGWRTSYYMHKDRWKACGAFNVNVDRCARDVADAIRKTKATSVSFHLDHYAFVKRHLEPLLPKNIEYHTFGLPPEYDIFRPDFSKFVARSPVFADRRVKTILLEGSKTIAP